MRRFVVMLAAITLFGEAYGASYTIDPNHTYPSWEVSHLGVSVLRGKFTKTTGKLTWDRETKTGNVQIEVDSASVESGHAKFNDHLRSADFFNVEKFPKITFQSTSFKFTQDTLTTVDGNLTLLGITKPLTLTVNGMGCTIHPRLKIEVCGADLVGSIRRSDFGMKYGTPRNGDVVTLRIQVEAHKEQ